MENVEIECSTVQNQSAIIRDTLKTDLDELPSYPTIVSDSEFESSFPITVEFRVSDVREARSS